MRFLVDVHDYDSRIDRRDAGRALPKPSIERVVLDASKEIKYGSGVFAKKSEVIERQGGKRDAEADQEGGAVAPPGEEEFVDAVADSTLSPVGC